MAVMPLAGEQGEAHSVFWSSVNSFPTSGADYAQHITACQPGFENLGGSLHRNGIGSRDKSMRKLLVRQFELVRP